MNQKNIILPITVLAAALLCGLVIFLQAGTVRANPSFFTRSNGTSAATTSPAFMSPGAGTSTETFNTSTGLVQAMDKASLYVFLIGSSTNPTAYATTTYNINIEYSDNCKDWGGDVFIDGTANATTSQNQAVSAAFTRTITLPGPTPTLNGIAIGTTTGLVRVMSIPTPTRCVRAVASIPAGSPNGAIWMQFIGTKQTQ